MIRMQLDLSDELRALKATLAGYRTQGIAPICPEASKALHEGGARGWVNPSQLAEPAGVARLSSAQTTPRLHGLPVRVGIPR